jgi:hypothetical protein
MKRFSSLLLVCVSVLALSACSNAKEKLGLSRKPPDEFAVVKRAPLAMPPDFSLRPPAPGMARPQEAAVEEKAREVVFGGRDAAPAKPAATSTENFVLQQTGGNAADPSIRQEVDSEIGKEGPDNRPVAERLLGWTGVVGDSDPDGASVVDAQAEAERLKKNVEEGKPVTEGETPVKE